MIKLISIKIWSPRTFSELAFSIFFTHIFRLDDRPVKRLRGCATDFILNCKLHLETKWTEINGKTKLHTGLKFHSRSEKNPFFSRFSVKDGMKASESLCFCFFCFWRYALRIKGANFEQLSKWWRRMKASSKWKLTHWPNFENCGIFQIGPIFEFATLSGWNSKVLNDLNNSES